MLARLLDAGLERPPALRCALLGGAPLPPALLARAARPGVPVAQTYGMTEACSQVTTSETAPSSRPLFCTRGRDRPRRRDPRVAARRSRPARAARRRLHTGDLGALDDAGRLRVTGRKADTIVTGGENVAPAEVEAVLAAHPAVAEAAVHGRPDAEWGEAVVAHRRAARGAVSEAELRAFARQRLARFKVPKAIAFVDALPRTASGKLLRRAL